MDRDRAYAQTRWKLCCCLNHMKIRADFREGLTKTELETQLAELNQVLSETNLTATLSDLRMLYIPRITMKTWSILIHQRDFIVTAA